MPNLTVTQYRQDLHRIPELDFDLPTTLAYLRSHLKELGGEVLEPAPSSLCVYFDNGQPDTIALRADMDGLPVTESETRTLRSTHVGQMHACGHDAHMAMLLATCDYVSSHRDQLPHNVLAVFQPAEETTGGAKAICESGVFEDHNVVAVFGLHMWPGYRAGEIISRPGELMARTSEVKIDVTGHSVHIAKAEAGHDALLASARLVTELEQLPRPDADHLLGFGLLRAGSVGNVIAGEARLEGSMRAYNDQVYDTLRTQLFDTAARIETETGCRFQIDVSSGYPPVINNPGLFATVEEQIDIPITPLPSPSMTGEDFSFYQRLVPGVFFFLGTGHDDALHSQSFTLDEAALPRGVDFLRQLLNLELS